MEETIAYARNRMNAFHQLVHINSVEMNKGFGLLTLDLLRIWYVDMQ